MTSKTMDIKKISKKEALSFGWRKTGKHAAFLLPVMLFLLSISFADEIIQIFLENELLIFSLSAIISIFSIFLTMGLINIALIIYDGKKPQFNDLFSCYSLFFRFFVASILYLLIVAGGFILLIIPGIIWGLQFYFVECLVIDKKMGPIEALKKSLEITRGNRANLLLFLLLLVLINIIGFIALFVGLLVTMPVSLLATTFFYRKLLEQKEEKEEPAVD